MAPTMPTTKTEPRTGLAYLEMGAPDAPLLLLLHGFPDIAESWLEVMPPLARAGHRVVAPHMPGYRPSPAPPAYDIDTLSEVLVRFASALQPAPATWVGHDWGAAITHVALGSGAVSRAVTMSVPHPLSFLRYAATHPGQLRRSHYMAFFQLPRLPERAIERGYVADLWSRWSGGGVVSTEHVRRVEARIQQSLPGPLEYYRAMFWPLGDFARRARAIEPSAVPTLHLHGARDQCIVPAAARDQARWFRGPYELRILTGGHFLPTDCPAEVASAILDWV